MGQEQVLTFKEAVEIALKENVNIKSQYNQLQTIGAQRLNNKAQYLPSVSISGGGSRTDGQQINNQTGVGENITSDFFQAGIGARLPLFNGMSRISNLKSSHADFHGQEHSIARSKQQVIVDVANQFLQVLLDQELLKISQQNLETQKKLLEQIRNFKEVGTRPITDLYNQEAQVKNLEVQVLRSQNALRNDKSILAQILQIEPVLDFQVVNPNWDVNSINLKGIELNNLYENMFLRITFVT
jgi:outer membrane protein